MGLMVSRCKLLSTMRITASSSSRLRTMAGMVFSPARSAAWSRLCPATISYPPSGAGRMMAGLRTPTCMMLSMVCCMSSSSVTLKGWFLKGRISESGICCTCSLGFCFGTVASPPENAKAAGNNLRLR